MITMESWTEGIKSERHKEESLISSQFLKNQKKSKDSLFLIVLFNKNYPLLQWVHAIYMSWKKLTKY